MKGTTTGQHIVDEVKTIFEKFKIDPKKFCGITTDGAAAMTGKIKGFTKLFMDKLEVKKSDIVVNHCIIYQENLCSKVLGFEDIMKKVVQSVNFIRSQALNHRQFKAMLDELDSDYGDFVYFSNVRWLSRAATLKRFWDLKTEIKNFKKEKGQDVAFFDDKRFLTDLAFLVNITQHHSGLNLKLQGKNQLVNKTFEHIQSFNRKLELFQSQLKKRDIVYLGT